MDMNDCEMSLQTYLKVKCGPVVSDYTVLQAMISHTTKIFKR